MAIPDTRVRERRWLIFHRVLYPVAVDREADVLHGAGARTICAARPRRHLENVSPR